MYKRLFQESFTSKLSTVIDSNLSVLQALDKCYEYLKSNDIEVLSDVGMGRKVYDLGETVLKIVRVERLGKDRRLDDFVFEDGLKQNKTELFLYSKYKDILPKFIDSFTFKNEVLFLEISKVLHFDNELDFISFFKEKTKIQILKNYYIEDFLYDILKNKIQSKSQTILKLNFQKTYIDTNKILCDYESFKNFQSSSFMLKLKKHFSKNKNIMSDLSFKNIGYDNIRDSFVILDIGNVLEENKMYKEK